ncbi:MAG: phosphate acyltransferase PlsX [Planctomycetota bacterium]|nr:phosphate acyltransferase PlsX [Planctomycetota bacterium]
MRIAVDMLGGDHAPHELVIGIAQALLSGDFTADELLLVGPQDIISAQFAELGVSDVPEILHTTDVIEGHEKPIEGMRSKPDASILKAVAACRDGLAGGIVAFGNTGAAVAASTIGLGLLPGVRRPGIAVTLVGANGKFVLLDAGANPNPKPEHLFHYALMGAAFSRDMHQHSNPTIGLLNIGGEASKGSPLLQEVHKRLEDSGLNFVGNVEGNQLFNGVADVLVTDGFVGNMVLKVVEGFGERVIQVGHERGHDEQMKDVVRQLLGVSDFSEAGGAILLGVNGVVLVGHGRSKASAVLPVLEIVRAEIKAGVNQHIVESLQAHTQNS